MLEHTHKSARLMCADVYQTLGVMHAASFVATVISNDADRVNAALSYTPFQAELIRLLVPGGHLVASNDTRRHEAVAFQLERAGFEQRGVIARLLRYEQVSDEGDLASGWEPWILLRKPLAERTVAENLRRHAAGALRRISQRTPMLDLYKSSAGNGATDAEVDADYLRFIARSVTPLRSGVVLEPLAASADFAAACVAEDIAVVSVFERESAYRAALKALEGV